MALNSLPVKQTEFVKDNWKFILGIAATFGITYVAWSIYKSLTDKEDPSNRGENLSENTKFPPSTLTDSEAVMIANRLQNAMGTFGSSNAEEVAEIKSLLTDLSYNDYVKVSKAFGERGYITMTGISKDSDWLAPKKPLSYWLTKELSSSDLDALKQIIPGIF